MSDIKVPAIPEPLIRVLDEQFPEMSPNPRDDEREIWMKAGERRLIRYLLEQYKRQNEIIMET